MASLSTDVKGFDPGDKKYGAIYADPPWHWKTWSAKGRIKTPDVHYECLTDEELKAIPVGDWCLPDCVLFMWISPEAMLMRALSVAEAWGFEYKTFAFVWAKTTVNGKWFFGQGSWTRGNPDVCLLLTKGKPKRLSRAVRKLVVARKGRHSAKPIEVMGGIEKLVAGPYLELFARTRRAGWDQVGLELSDDLFELDDQVR